MSEEAMYKVRIRRGARIFQDMMFSRWPVCHPPSREFGPDEEYEHRTGYPDAIFDATWRLNPGVRDGGYWDCRRDGYGTPGDYGSGSIFVYDVDGVEVIEPRHMPSSREVFLTDEAL